MNYFNDEFTFKIDKLGSKKQAKIIRELILNARTPFSIGVSGRWGSGKTSIMKYLMASLRGKPLEHRLQFQDKTIKEENHEKIEFDKIFTEFNSTKENKTPFSNIHCIWFNPWEHEANNEPFIELLREIKNYFSILSQSKDKTGKILHVVSQAGLDMFGSFLKLGKNPASNIKNIGEQYEYDNFQYIGRNQRFKLIFQEAIKKLLKTKTNNSDEPSKDEPDKDEPDKDGRIVIFIDDLDRCEDQIISKLLKEIKQYLSTQKCVFVFGYDRHHIEKALATHELKTSKEARTYLEKLFQTTFYIKQPNEKQIEKFIKEHISNKDEYKIKNENQIEIAKFIASIIDPNPRRIKSYLMTLYFHIKNSEFNDKKIINNEDIKKLCLIAYLKLFYESVYSALENYPELISNIKDVFTKSSRFELNNPNEYFLYLEFISHLSKDIPKSFIDDDYTLKIKELENSRVSENKFLNEIYEMQGKHQSFENYKEEFKKCFGSINNKNIQDLKKYI